MKKANIDSILTLMERTQSKPTAEKLFQQNIHKFKLH